MLKKRRRQSVGDPLDWLAVRLDDRHAAALVIQTIHAFADDPDFRERWIEAMRTEAEQRRTLGTFDWSRRNVSDPTLRARLFEATAIRAAIRGFLPVRYRALLKPHLQRLLFFAFLIFWDRAYSPVAVPLFVTGRALGLLLSASALERVARLRHGLNTDYLQTVCLFTQRAIDEAGNIPVAESILADRNCALDGLASPVRTGFDPNRAAVPPDIPADAPGSILVDLDRRYGAAELKLILKDALARTMINVPSAIIDARRRDLRRQRRRHDSLDAPIDPNDAGEQTGHDVTADPQADDQRDETERSINTDQLLDALARCEPETIGRLRAAYAAADHPTQVAIARQLGIRDRDLRRLFERLRRSGPPDVHLT